MATFRLKPRAADGVAVGGEQRDTGMAKPIPVGGGVAEWGVWLRPRAPGWVGPGCKTPASDGAIANPPRSGHVEVPNSNTTLWRCRSVPITL